MMTPQFFSKITLRNSASTTRILQTLLADGYAPHKVVWQLLSYSPEQRRNFLFRYDIEPRSGIPQFYVLSEQRPRTDHSLWNVQIARHSYSEYLEHLNIQGGSMFRFMLRANPTYSPPKKYRTTPSEKRRDLIIHLRKQLPRDADGVREEPHAATEHRACKEWLERRKHIGFELVEPHELLLVRGYDQIRFRHKNHTIILSRVDMEGVLRVTDVQKFQENLRQGIGHGKAFGCGLLLIKPL
ncbi:MAG: type I-E CRISPR-associated protein Cas6/Cse3/CasE [Bacteroidota bacterium]|nr:type I-E CRISPR-associated protein Cas6/Cse3/CasE [Candidatus Kapabacteria bacterium]MDW8220792.1 type I-E CRISPR-associated protein Cas6/Cse3/CasE [Bacteroidota bacterium]